MRGERKIIDFHILVNIFSFFFYLIFLYIHKSSSSQISTYIRQHTARARNTTIVLSREEKKNSKSKDIEGCENGWWISLALYLYKIQFFYDLYIHHLWKTIPFFCRRCRVFFFNFLLLMQINNAPKYTIASPCSNFHEIGIGINCSRIKTEPK